MSLVEKNMTLVKMHRTFDCMELASVLLAGCWVAWFIVFPHVDKKRWCTIYGAFQNDSDDGILHLGLLDIFICLIFYFEYKTAYYKFCFFPLMKPDRACIYRFSWLTCLVLRITFCNRHNCVSASTPFHLRIETYLLSKMLHSVYSTRWGTKARIPVILDTVLGCHFHWIVWMKGLLWGQGWALLWNVKQQLASNDIILILKVLFWECSGFNSAIWWTG